MDKNELIIRISTIPDLFKKEYNVYEEDLIANKIITEINRIIQISNKPVSSSIDYKGITEYSTVKELNDSKPDIEFRVNKVGVSINALSHYLKTNSYIKSIFKYNYYIVDYYIENDKDWLITVRLKIGATRYSKVFIWDNNTIYYDIANFILCKIEPEVLMGYYEELNDYKSLLEISEDINNERKKILYRFIGNAYADNKKYIDALEYYNLSLCWDNKNAATIYNIGLIYYEMGKYEKARYQWNEALKYDKKGFRIYNNLGVLAHERNDTENAIKYFKLAVKYEKNDTVHRNLGMTYTLNHSTDKAIIEFKKALRYNPDAPQIYYNLAVFSNDKGNVDDAILYYKTAIKYKNDYIDAYLNLSVLYIEMNDYDNCLKYSKEVLKYEENNPKAYLNMGNAYYFKGSTNTAINIFNEGISKQPTYSLFYRNLGYIYYKEGKYYDAIKYYELLNKYMPQDTVSIIQLFKLYTSLGLNDKADKFFNSFGEDTKQIILKDKETDAPITIITKIDMPPEPR